MSVFIEKKGTDAPEGRLGARQLAAALKICSSNAAALPHSKARVLLSGSRHSFARAPLHSGMLQNSAR